MTSFAYIDNAGCSKMSPRQAFVCSVSHHFMGWKNEETMNNFQDNGLIMLKFGGREFFGSEFKFIKKFYV